ncbi:hypothetical protein GGI17_002113 [Coemansia sp. S146]|nr:hypothetical protein GGI17_002113 [Coemansia sp. S146]
MCKRISKIVFCIPATDDLQFVPSLHATEACGPLYASDRWVRAIHRQLRGRQLVQGQTALVIVGSQQVQLSVDKLFEESASIADKYTQTGVVDGETVFEVQRRSQATTQRSLPGYNNESEGLSSEISGYFASKTCFRYLNIKPVQSIYICGVTGVGKSTVIKHALERAGYPIVYGDLRAMVASASGTEMADEYIAMTLDDIVARARALAPSVILIDRVDTFGDVALLSGNEELTKLATNFAKFIDSIPHDVFLVLESSVELGELPVAARRYEALQHCQIIGVPTAPRREQIVRAVLGELLAELTHSDSVHQEEIDTLCRRVAAATPGYVARDIARLCRQALLRMVRGSDQPQSADSVSDLAGSMTHLSLVEHDTVSCSMAVTMTATVPAWRWFSKALQIVRPSQQLEFESARPAKRWADIGGYEAIKLQLQRFVRLATSETPSRLGITLPSGILLHGPSGCGKTALALAMIGESTCNVIFIRGSELFSKYLGETEARLRRLFHTARAAAPCIVFMDEIDSIAAKREWSSVESGGPSLRVLSTLLNEMDGVHETSGVVTVGCTNQVCKIDDAILRPVHLHIRSLIYMLYILQLLRPVNTARDIVSMPPLSNAKDAFSSVPVRSPKELEFGYQLISKARILNGDGYNLALDAYNDEVKHRLDLTTCYLDTNVYDMTNKDGAVRCWSDLHMSVMTEAKHLPSTHVLFGIGLPYYWIMDVSLDGRQTKVLHSYVDEKQFLTPLDDPNLLADAAKRVGTTLEEACRYFQHQHSEMAKKSSKCKAYHVSRKRYVKKHVERAKAIEVEWRKLKRMVMPMAERTVK